jgi:hypothetical protein
MELMISVQPNQELSIMVNDNRQPSDCVSILGVGLQKNRQRVSTMEIKGFAGSEYSPALVFVCTSSDRIPVLQVYEFPAGDRSAYTIYQYNGDEQITFCFLHYEPLPAKQMEVA